jgi:uric acid transporter
VVASIPLPVLGGAGLVLFGSVAAAGIQTLSRVDLTDNRNLIIVAVAVAVGIIPAALPEFYDEFPEAVRIVFESGITAASVAAILLNILFNILGGGRAAVGDQEEYTGVVEENLTVMQANDFDREAFVERFAPLFQGQRWVAEEAYERRPFTSIYDLRHAFSTAVFDAPQERQLELIRSYPALGKGTVGGDLSRLSVRDRSAVGLDRLTPEEEEDYRRMNEAYEGKFSFPLVTAIREHTRDTILEDAESRMRHSREQEIMASLFEVVKIANLRLEDLIEKSLVGAGH